MRWLGADHAQAPAHERLCGMPRRRGVLGPPNGYVAHGGTWPAGPFVENVPQSVLVAAGIAERLKRAVEEAGLNVSEVAEGLGVARSTYYDILNGTTFPDLHTLVGAETFLNIRLWPEV